MDAQAARTADARAGERVRAVARLTRVGAVVFLSSIASAMNTTSDPLHGPSLDDLHLAGDVCSVFVEQGPILQSSSGSIEGGRSPVERIHFDGDGLVREWVRYDGSRNPDSIRRYAYDDGLLVAEELYRPPGRLPAESIVYTHSEDRTRTAAEVRRGNGWLRRTIVYERSADGKLRAVTESDAEGIIEYRVVYTYSGSEKRADRYDEDGDLTSWSIERLDESGRPVEVRLYSQGSEDSPFTIAYEYDDRGNVTMEQTSGRLVIGLASVTPPTGTSTSYEYTYDESGNWVTRVKSIWVADDDPHWLATQATYRTIEYCD